MGWRQLYAVLRPHEAARELRRLKLGRGVAVVQPKYDGFLVVAERGVLVKEPGEPLYRRAVEGLRRAGLLERIVEASFEATLVLEVYGSALPWSVHRGHPLEWDAVLLDVAELGGLESGGPLRVKGHLEAEELASRYSLPYAGYDLVEFDASRRVEEQLLELLEDYRGWEGCVVKLYDGRWRLPGKWRVRGALMIKARWAWASSGRGQARLLGSRARIHP